MKRVLTLFAIAMAVSSAFAMKAFLPTFTAEYKIKPTSNIGKAGCAACHTSAKGGKLNAYGLDLKAELKKNNTKKLTPAILKSVEDKWLPKIKADKLP